MNKYISFLSNINFKTLYFNFKYLPFKQAIKLPFLISRRVFLYKTKGEVVINGPIYPGMIKIGLGKIGFFDMKRSRSMWDVLGKVVFNGRASLGQGTKVSVGHSGVLEFGNGFATNAEVTIVSRNSVKLGDYTGVSWNCFIMDTDFHNIYDKDGNIINQSKPVIVGNHVLIGCNNVILKGAKISDNSIVGANSMVSKDISDKSGIFIGNPIKLYKEDVTWEM